MTLGRHQQGCAGAVGAAGAELGLWGGGLQSLIPLRPFSWSCSPSVGSGPWLEHPVLLLLLPKFLSTVGRIGASPCHCCATRGETPVLGCSSLLCIPTWARSCSHPAVTSP